jgi:tetratricopeptide (TPR) repeat protein
MSRRIRFLIMGLLVSLLLPIVAKTENEKSAMECFFEANQAYQNDLFQEAANGYLELIENGFENGHIDYNLGNTFFRLNDLGKAILYYERARLLMPRDSDLIFNLSHARNQALDAVSDSRRFPLNDVLGLDSVNLYEAFFAFTLMNVFFFGMLFIRLFKKAEWTYYLSIFLAIGVGIGACAFTLKGYELITDDRAVVISKEVEVRAGPDPGDTVLFKIHEGAVVHYERSEGDWVLLHLSKDKRGWAESKQVERIVKK